MAGAVLSVKESVPGIPKYAITNNLGYVTNTQTAAKLGRRGEWTMPPAVQVVVRDEHRRAHGSSRSLPQSPVAIGTHGSNERETITNAHVLTNTRTNTLSLTLKEVVQIQTLETISD